MTRLHFRESVLRLHLLGQSKCILRPKVFHSRLKFAKYSVFSARRHNENLLSVCPQYAGFRHSVLPDSNNFASLQFRNVVTSEQNYGKPHSGQCSKLLTIILGCAVVVGISYKICSNSINSVCEEKEKVTDKRDDNNNKRTVKSLIPGNKKLTLDEAIEKSRDIAQRIKDETGSPGLVVAVSIDGQEVWSEGLGYADVENRVPCTPDTVLRIASISKPIAMVTVARLWESGQLDLDKPIQFYLPKFPEKTVNGEKVTITTRQLTSHLSGIRHYSKDYLKNNKDQKSNETVNKEKREPNSKDDQNIKTQKTVRAEADYPEFHIKEHYSSVTDSLKLFKDDPLVHKPGSKYLYTSHGFTLISAVVEAVAKKPFDKLMRELFRELGMEHTYLDENDPLIYNRGRHYVKNRRGRLVNAPYVDLSYKWAGGGLLSTASDILKFGNIMLYSYQNRKYTTLLNDGKNSSHKNESNQNNLNDKLTDKNLNLEDVQVKKNLPGILKPETVKMLWDTVEKTESEDKERQYGMGWELVTEKSEFGSCRHRRFYPYHTGGALGGSSVLLILPPETEEFKNKGKQPPYGICVAILINMVSIGLTKTAFEIAKIFENTLDDSEI